jgi:hypothetical protein
MDEPDAKPFWATLEAILRRTQLLPIHCPAQPQCHANPLRTGPLIALLDNVYGVLAVKEKAKSWCIQFLLN